jgi:DNA-binding GntR family transcriptional regulator
MARMLTEMTVYRRLYDQHNYELWRKGRDHHTQLIKALRSGDATAARRIMASHMCIAEALMKAQEAELSRQFIQD